MLLIQENELVRNDCIKEFKRLIFKCEENC